MAQSRVRNIKHAQKESQLFKEISQNFVEVLKDQPSLQGLFINRVSLSPSKGMCTVYFYTAGGIEQFKKLLSTLILYKPSMRHMLSKRITGRYTPDLIFEFDDQFEKQQEIETLLDKIKDEEKL